MTKFRFGCQVGFLISAFSIFLIDQLSKLAALKFLQEDEEFVMNKFISLHRVFNNDTIMLDWNVYENSSNFAFHFPWQFNLFYVSISFLLSAGIIWVTNQPALKESSTPNEVAKTGLFLILGGMWGNLFDRAFRRDGVIDFLRLNVLEDSVPIINFADVALVFGEACLVVAWVLVLADVVKKKLPQTLAANS